MACRALGHFWTSSKMITELRDFSDLWKIACSRRKMKSKSMRSSNRDLTSSEALLKSIRMYVSYSLWANSSTMVDFPIRRAPSISKAVRPLLSDFHSSIFA